MPTTQPHLFAEVLSRVQGVCRALADQGALPAGLDLSRIVVEPPRDAAHGDMATNAAMVLAKDAKAKPRDLAERDRRAAARRSAGRGGRGRRTGLHQSDAQSLGLAGGADCGPARRQFATAAPTAATAKRSTSNTSRPIRPGRCMSATAAARCSAMRWRACCNSPATTSRASTTSTTPARRSTCSRARRSCAIAKRLARRSATFRKDFIPATI